jgi:hypothetical protein
VTAGGSYLSSHGPRVIIGLGSVAKVEWVEIDWPLPSKHTIGHRLIQQFRRESWRNGGRSLRY